MDARQQRMAEIEANYPTMQTVLWAVWREKVQMVGYRKEKDRELVTATISEHKARRLARRIGGTVERREV